MGAVSSLESGPVGAAAENLREPGLAAELTFLAAAKAGSAFGFDFDPALRLMAPDRRRRDGKGEEQAVDNEEKARSMTPDAATFHFRTDIIAEREQKVNLDCGPRPD
jgi:hypothetical protein